MTIGVIATLTIVEGKNEEFEAVFSELVEKVKQNEKGCNFYQLHKSRTNGQIYVVLEQYVDQAALEHHGGTDYFRELGKKMGGCLAAAPGVEYFDGV